MRFKYSQKSVQKIAKAWWLRHLFLFVCVVVTLVFFVTSPISAQVFVLLSQQGNLVSVSASVPPNPYNSSAQQLLRKEAELKVREKALEADSGTLSMQRRRQTIMLSSNLLLTTVLISLVGVNFYLDWKRQQHA